MVKPGDHGSHILALQRLLKRNKWGVEWYRGKLDGEYGPQTLLAVREARYRLGYPTKYIRSGIVGGQLGRYLDGSRHLPVAYRARRAARRGKHYHRLLPLRLRRFAIAKRHLGYEEGANNSTIFGRWYGLPGQPWCGMFWSFCDVMAGGNFRYAYTPTISQNACDGINGLHRTYTPQRGDGVTFDWEMRHSVPGTDHVGFFDRWEDRHSGTFLTIEGNTGPQSGSGPEGVYRRQRYTSEVVVFFTAD